ncbi:hypothetical protein [Leptospira neocaledonica]|uniref:Uncharacterized protein n=1 Tax=Leptospira neocaledonica TaxID=2023192 RepID=A0A2M9ZT99_9LEPT|nr:hypothetical protein [Leptospira neocaledonica]PJZ75322.1 hypothetical protein CH365_19575 [Leptospira neocaledonica]
MKIEEVFKTEIKESNSILSFQTTGGGSWEVWDRFIAIDGKQAYHIGNICGTCNFFFERMEGANQKVSQKSILETLSNDIIELNSNEYMEIEKLIPKGNYYVLKIRIVPRYVQLGTADDYFSNEQIEAWGIDGFWGLPHYPKTNYYRMEDYQVNKTSKIYNFLIPMVPSSWLDDKTIKDYEIKFSNSIIPTAIAISHLDVKEPAVYSDETVLSEHICFANYLIDGHHKIFASSQVGKEISLISFLSVDNNIASEEDIKNFIGNLSNGG